MPTPLLLKPRVPIIGQQTFKLVQWWTTVIIRCECVDTDQTVVVISGSAGVVCPRCQNVYSLNKLVYDRSQSEVTINIGVGVSPAKET